MTDKQLQNISERTRNDSTPMSLKDTIVNGWPNEKAFLQPGVALYMYYNFCDELRLSDGIILRGDRRTLLPATNVGCHGTESTA